MLRMIEIRENLPLGAQSLQNEAARDSRRGTSLIATSLSYCGIDAARAIHLAHAAVTDERDDLVSADALTDPAIGRPRLRGR